MKAHISKLRFCRSLKAIAWMTASLLGLQGAAAATHYRFLGLLPGVNDSPVSALIKGKDGALYATSDYYDSNSISASIGIFKFSEDGNTLTVFKVDGGGYDEYGPAGALLSGSDGALYSATLGGGDYGYGAVFKMGTDGTGYTVLHSFSDPDDGTGDGYDPTSGLTEGNDHALYGTTRYGGAFGNSSPNTIPGFGAVFRLNRDGTGYTILHSFGGFTNDGEFPQAGLVPGGDGALYGTTHNGGAHGGGTVFRLDTDGGSYAVLHSFGDTNDGAAPFAGLLQGSDGALYGTTQYGGATTNADFGGTVFTLDADGSGYRILHSFGMGEDGFAPIAALCEGSDGRLYGTTSGLLGYDPNVAGSDLAGSVFRINKDGSAYIILHRFSVDADQSLFSGLAEAAPLAGLVQGSDGVFYGTTSGSSFGIWGAGGEYTGSAFKLWPPETPDMDGVETASNTNNVSFTGVSGSSYQVLRSSDLKNWTALAIITMPPAGIFTFSDTMFSASNVFYRCAWLP